jgi:hypothetical protein
MRLITLDIDGLRRDAFLLALEQGRLPNFARILGGPEAAAGLHLEPLSNAPSITFSCQASLFTGAHPRQHGILGNQFYDRFGAANDGHPRFYAFDVGDSLDFSDAVRTFTGPLGLVGEVLPASVPTLYERASARGLTSTVVYHMLARGATHWLAPSLLDLARLTKGGRLLGMSAAAFDTQMVERAMAHLRRGTAPDVLTLYFLGLDHYSHRHGPGAQAAYVADVLDPLVGRLLTTLDELGGLDDTLFGIVSDHGHVPVVKDDRHSLRLSYPFDREMGYLFDTLGLDVHDLPGEGPNCNAVVGSNGGLALVYVQNRRGHWVDPPGFEQDVLPLAAAFWEAQDSGRYAPDLEGALDMILVRNVERGGWESGYCVWSPAAAAAGYLLPLHEYLQQNPSPLLVEAAARVSEIVAPTAPDLVLVACYADGFYFGGECSGTHGGLHPGDSEAVMSFGLPSGTGQAVAALRETVTGAVADRCRAEGRRRTGLVDYVTAVRAALGWDA